MFSLEVIRGEKKTEIKPNVYTFRVDTSAWKYLVSACSSFFHTEMLKP